MVEQQPRPVDFASARDAAHWNARDRLAREIVRPACRGYDEMLREMKPDWFCTLVAPFGNRPELILCLLRCLLNWINRVTFGRRFFRDRTCGVRGIYVLERASGGSEWHVHFFLKGARQDLDPVLLVDYWAHLCSRDAHQTGRLRPVGEDTHARAERLRAKIKAANRPAEAVRRFEPGLGAAAYLSAKVVMRNDWAALFGPLQGTTM